MPVEETREQFINRMASDQSFTESLNEVFGLIYDQQRWIAQLEQGFDDMAGRLAAVEAHHARY